MEKTSGAKIIQSLFDPKKIPGDAQKILQDFDQIAQSAMPANSKQLVALPKQIRELSHQMTDDRGSRRLGYMNEKTFLASYVRYFMWWNLVRLTRLFANLDFNFLSDGDVCLDIGSGPLTLPCALWLARPDLRSKKLVWYVMDISQGALSLGEEIFLSVAAATGGEPWKIVRVKGPLGTAVKEKAAFVTCANMFNEVLQSQKDPPDFLAKKYSQSLFKYLDFGTEGERNVRRAESEREAKNERGGQNCGGPAIFLAEPGTPGAARFVSLMRDAFIRRGLLAVAPCPHQQNCPMDGRRAGQNGATGKWCNFAFDTDDAPKKLLALSAKAGIPKERAVISFVFARAETAGKPKAVAARFGQEKTSGIATETGSKTKTCGGLLRIASDIIRVPAAEPGQKSRIGHYACSEQGLVLALSSGGRRVYSGDLVEVETAGKPKSGPQKSDASPKSGRRDFGQDNSFRPQRDAKTGALIVEI